MRFGCGGDEREGYRGGDSEKGGFDHEIDPKLSSNTVGNLLGLE